jgi:Tn3 transposase DDE domain
VVEFLPYVERTLARTGTGKVRMENGALVGTLSAMEELPASAERIQADITIRLLLVDLPALLIEVEQWTSFNRHLRHLHGQEPRRRDFLPVLYIAILAQGYTFALARMAQMADLPVAHLAWCTTWYLHEDTLKAATEEFNHTTIVTDRRFLFRCYGNPYWCHDGEAGDVDQSVLVRAATICPSMGRTAP